jgi:hypothetical protein
MTALDAEVSAQHGSVSSASVWQYGRFGAGQLGFESYLLKPIVNKD